MEDLAKEQSKLFCETRQAKKHNEIRSTWTNNNNIYVSTNEGNQIHIKNSDDIDFITKKRSKNVSNHTSTESFEGFDHSDIQEATRKAVSAAEQLKLALEYSKTVATFHFLENLT